MPPRPIQPTTACRPATPVGSPTNTEGLEAAWDPSSRTPIAGPRAFELLLNSAGSSSVEPERPQRQQHQLLDPRLVGISFQVKTTEGNEVKDAVVSPVSNDGSISIRRNHYRDSLFCNPEQVEIKHPNPTRDNGPLVVIRGEHCGKVVRRIHHKYDASNLAILKLAVVQRTGDELGQLTGEELELDASFLCRGVESKEQKTHLDRLVKETRETARKTRAK